MAYSVLDDLKLWAAQDPTACADYIRALPPESADAIRRRDWDLAGRPEQQIPPGEWIHWVVIAGRGWGKTLTGAQFVHTRVRRHNARHIAIVGATAADVRDVMVEGPSGILATAPMDFYPNYEPSKRRLTWPNGATGTTFSADEPERLRGPQHDTAWCDEPGTWRRGVETRDNFLFGFRLGDPRACWTTTPRNIPLVKELITHGRQGTGSVVLTHGTTYDNLHNLAPTFAQEIIRQYEGTRLGRQELYAELLDDLGAVFRRSWFAMLDPGTQYPAPIRVRYWDLAATAEGGPNDDPDWTAGAKVAHDPVTRTYVIEDIRRTRDTAGGVEALIRQTANEDGPQVHIGIEQEPGASGKAIIAHYRLNVIPDRAVNQGPPDLFRPSSQGSKAARAAIVAGPAEQGMVSMIRAQWNTALLDELEEFTGTNVDRHDDQVDALSGAFGMLRSAGNWAATTIMPGGWSTPSYWRQTA